MKILLTGATGYIGQRLLPLLVGLGHQVVCLVRDRARFHPAASLRPYLEVIEADLLNVDSLKAIPKDIEAAYYLVHSMASHHDYADVEQQSAQNFVEALSGTAARQVIYLSGIVNDEDLSEHLSSRLRVEQTLRQGTFALTTLRAGIIIGSGSASFEIIRDLVEKLPLMVAPKWVKTRCQPIAIANVLEILTGVLGNEACYGQSFDIGGPDVLSYKEMLLGYARVRGLKRLIFTVPVMTPRLSSYWLHFVTSVPYRLARALVDSMSVEVVCRDERIKAHVPFRAISYEEAIRRALDKIQNNEVASSWHDAMSSSKRPIKISDFIEVPTYGCFKDVRKKKIRDRQRTIERIWQIGGDKGWYYAQWLWRLRGLLDQAVGGVGLRRGRTHRDHIEAGDSVDFWRVLYANKEEGRLLLFAEMKLPGEAWLEFRIKDGYLWQVATFRPKGLWGRLYWYAVLPMHEIVFRGLIHRLTQ
ncbi:SDR family oxidoreductase [Thermonema rossianum]|uniref:SDR family oxidoreductase n=1 Tax=Thermonema rossianum TaxID=55505 RepID=UPI00056FA108|nr:SDR family oxidoreductase [Thermonema rossianum]